jgi:hypothetical protein
MDVQTGPEGTYQNDNAVDPFRITRNQYLADHNGKTRGTANPSVMDKPFWKYMITRGGSAYSARQLFHNKEDLAKEGEIEYVKYPDWPFDPVWCFSRFGGTVTKLPDGRCVHIGGEHEDFYDPDFCIYNDVVVIATPPLSNPSTSSIPEDDIPDDYDIPLSRAIASENIIIYGYPLDVFPPTDFHTSTYVCDPRSGKEFIYIIGGLGYERSASRDRTDVYRLDLSDFSIRRLETIGAKPPGGTNRHNAELYHSTYDTEPRIKITTEDGRQFSLLTNTLEWISHGSSLTFAQKAAQAAQA